MKALGIVFLIIGVPLCLTLIFTPIGFGFCGVGTLLIIASAIVRRQRAQEELAQQGREYRGYDRGQDVDPQATQRARIANSQFGR
jgi:hypothetical protein